MTHLAEWLSPVLLRLLALALLHFLWQGAALAALAFLTMEACRSAAIRYAVGVGALTLMFAAPIGTFLFLEGQNHSNLLVATTVEVSRGATAASMPVMGGAKHGANPAESTPPPYFFWLVEGWFAGVVLLSLRAAGGFFLVERLRHLATTPVTEELLEMCRSLERRMRVKRVVRYCESIRLDAPAVAGWIRPVVLLPMAAIAGLSQEELGAVIAHELAHIRRLDAFVNLFQTGVETMLFYHPAVWWLGKRIRLERENCCDDAAVALCGSPVTYVGALARLAEWKAAPQLAMAANRGPLVERMARLLGANRPTASLDGANLSAGLLCLFTALIAGSALLGNLPHTRAQTPAAPPAPVAQAAASPARATSVPRVPETAIVVRPEDPEADVAAAAALVSPRESNPQASAARETTSSAQNQSYIDSLKDAGLTNLTVEELIGLKVQGVTGAYVKAMKELGLSLNADELIAMKVQGVTPEYMRGIRAATGQTLDSDALIGLKVQGVTPEYVAQMQQLGLKTDADDLMGMKVQGVTPEYVREMRGLGLKMDSDDIVGMKVQGVTPEYVKSFQELGLHPDTDEIIAMKVQGVTAAYLKELQSAGFKVGIDDAIAAKIQGVTPEFIAKVRSRGFKDLTLEKVIALKINGILDAER